MNPGLEKFDISEYKGVENKNFYEMDSGLQRVLDRYTRDFSEDHRSALKKHISDYGSLCGGILNELTLASHKEGKYGELVKYDRAGNRIDEIVYCREQTESRRISYEHGVVNLDFHKDWKFSFAAVHRYALAYLMNMNGEGGVSCPLAMTDGMILALKAIGTEEQKKKYLPLVAGEGSRSHFMAGQYVTERVGGSNVAANRTVAVRKGDGKWILTGEKWFCSNPGDLWVTTAKVSGTNTVGLFLVPRFKDDGTLNHHNIIRKKDIIGSRGKVTTEIIYEGVEAEEFGRTGHGLANLMKYVIRISRLHVGIGAAGNSARAVFEALEYARFRSAYGKNLTEFPIYARELSEMRTHSTALLHCNFRSIDEQEKETLASAVTLPLMKYISSKLAAELSHRAVLCLGGNGILGDFSVIPRMLNDSVINETWEGTHFLMGDHILHALERKKSGEAFLALVSSNADKGKEFKELSSAAECFSKKFSALKGFLSSEREFREMNRMAIADTAYECFSLSEMILEASDDLKKGKQDSVYADFASGLADIYGRQNGAVSADSPYLSSEKRKRMIHF